MSFLTALYMGSEGISKVRKDLWNALFTGGIYRQDHFPEPYAGGHGLNEMKSHGILCGNGVIFLYGIYNGHMRFYGFLSQCRMGDVDKHVNGVHDKAMCIKI
jgi:hypothetical protein